jgi:hypothetical protein
MKHTHTPACPEWAAYLAALHPDDLSPRQQAELADHLAACPACQAQRAAYQAMAFRVQRLPSVRPLAALPPQLVRQWSAHEYIPLKPGLASVDAPGRASAERRVHLVPLPAQHAAKEARDAGAAAPAITLAALSEDDSQAADEGHQGLSGVGEPVVDDTYLEVSHLAEREVTGLAGLPERVPQALAALPPIFSFARPARYTSQWQALVACFVIVPLLLVIMPLGALQRLGQGAAGSTLDAYIQPLSFAQKCVGLLALPSVSITLDNSQHAQPLDWHISIQDTDPSGSLPWAKADVTSGTVPAGAHATFTVMPLPVLCEIMEGAPAPIDYHVIFFSQGQRTTMTDRITPG